MDATGGKRKEKPVSDPAGEDGDFVQLRIVRERRKQQISSNGPAVDKRSIPEGAVIEEKQVTFREEPKIRPTTAARERADDDLRELIFATVDTNDHRKLMSVISSIGKNNLLQDIRNKETDVNVLHYALSHDKMETAINLIDQCSLEMLTSHHVVHKSGVSGRNNCLHIITEKNDIEMAKLLLSKLPSTEKKLDVIKLETAIDIEGQRPRLFSCLHLAAYYGHTQLVRLYLDTGIDVNHLNGKDDTALLWAARWGHNETVSLLLDRGADTEVLNDKGSTALYWAIRYEFPKTVGVLLQKGKANPNTKRKLGLVAPIVIAAAYGNVEIMSLLLQHPDIDIHVRIRGGEMAVHHAAKEGCTDVLDMLIKRGAKFDEQDEIGDTPLLLAAKNGNYDIVHNLIRRGANVNHRNHEGHDAWYFAIEDEEDNSLLSSLVSATRGQDMLWRHPLCIAASNGRIDKIKCLLNMHIEPISADADGNTFLHHAAMSDKHEVIDKFNSTISINIQNNRGNTPLHIACYRGYSNTVKVLLKYKAKADVKNSKGETALHVAGYSKHITAETARELVDYIIKTHAWESLNDKDNEGNNPLHIAGKHAKPEVLWEFRFVRFKDRDKDGLIPLHEAVRPGQPEALDMMLDIFESMKRDARINEQSYATSETVLHLAASEGHSRCVQRLIGLGADLSCKDVNGNTVLHRLTLACVEDSKNISRHLEVLETVFDNVVKWWCIKKNIPFPEEENREVYMSYRRDSTQFLVNNVVNGEGLSVLDMAFKYVVPDILSRLLMMPDVTKYDVTKDIPTGVHTYSFDITGITPRTNNAIRGCCSRASVSPLLEKDMNADVGAGGSRLSGLEWLITHTVKTRAAEILDLPPIQMIERYYTSMVAWTFALLMVVHIVYMSVFTYVGIDLLEKLRNASSISYSNPETVLLYAFVPLEPAVIILYMIWSTGRYLWTGDIKRKARLSRKSGFALGVSIFGSYIFLVVCTVFAGLVLAWIALFSVRYTYNDYFFSSAVCIGWLLTVSFTRGIRAIHYFYRMLLSMMLRDVVRFGIVYLFVILAFGFAFHALFQVSQDIVNDYLTVGDTLFLTFNMMIGMGQLFEGEYEKNLVAVGRTPAYSKILYLIYIILSTIILLNLLIAMMNDSYTTILRENQVTWRIEVVSLGVEMESSFPMAGKFSNVQIKHGGVDSIVNGVSPERWYVSIADAEFREQMREMDRKYYTNQEEVTKRLNDLDSKMVEMERLTSNKLQQITDLLEQIKRK
ncbi:ankyrin-3-like [Dreissena polymorpha]|uniref:Ion transport domain-containing protein n=1 Tax=Dreissena polymorpha TaxID=45954 RepID=A0A9D4GXT1_DREPO|nr:ankyrin-3-like [Dreissena polymorpha]XP_052284770.1 ankyrin-3-like [Dreissena polymorpha]KAH3824965.1 hypothetical protein DPMN_126825 [Dreissena polymorpha]